MQVTLELPDDIFEQLQPLEDKLPQVLKLGLREFNAMNEVGFSGTAEVMEFLASLPTPEAIIALRPSEALQAQISLLLEKSQTVGLTATEEQIWEAYQYLEHLVRIAKAKAFLKLQEASLE